MTHPDDPATKADIYHSNDRIDKVGSDIKLLKIQTKMVESKLEDLGSDVRRLEVLFEAMGDDIKAILETVAPKIQQVTKHEDTLEEHDGRITTLERFKNATV